MHEHQQPRLCTTRGSWTSHYPVVPRYRCSVHRYQSDIHYPLLYRDTYAIPCGAWPVVYHQLHHRNMQNLFLHVQYQYLMSSLQSSAVLQHVQSFDIRYEYLFLPCSKHSAIHHFLRILPERSLSRHPLMPLVVDLRSDHHGRSLTSLESHGQRQQESSPAYQARSAHRSTA